MGGVPVTTAGEIVVGERIRVAGEVELGGRVGLGDGVVIVPGDPDGDVTQAELDAVAASVTALDTRLTAHEQQQRDYPHTQTQPAEIWQIHHGLGFRPNFTAYDTNGAPIAHGGITHPVPGQISEVRFGAPTAGSGYAS